MPLPHSGDKTRNQWDSPSQECQSSGEKRNIGHRVTKSLKKTLWHSDLKESQVSPWCHVTVCGQHGCKHLKQIQFALLILRFAHSFVQWMTKRLSSTSQWTRPVVLKWRKVWSRNVASSCTRQQHHKVSILHALKCLKLSQIKKTGICPGYKGIGFLTPRIHKGHQHSQLCLFIQNGWNSSKDFFGGGRGGKEG